jgi:hypothetical protein
MTYFTLTDDEKLSLTEVKDDPEKLFKVVEQILEDSIDWKPGRWWSVYSADGSLWCETSDEEEAWQEHKERKCSTIHRQYVSEQFIKLVDMTRRSKSD